MLKENNLEERVSSEIMTDWDLGRVLSGYSERKARKYRILEDYLHKVKESYPKIKDYVFKGAIMGSLAYLAVEVSGLYDVAAKTGAFLGAYAVFWRDDLKKKADKLIYRALLSGVVLKPITFGIMYSLPEAAGIQEGWAEIVYRASATIGILYPVGVARYLILKNLLEKHTLKEFISKLKNPVKLTRETYAEIRGSYKEILHDAYVSGGPLILVDMINYGLTPSNFVLKIDAVQDFVADFLFFTKRRRRQKKQLKRVDNP